MMVTVGLSENKWKLSSIVVRLSRVDYFFVFVIEQIGREGYLIN